MAAAPPLPLPLSKPSRSEVEAPDPYEQWRIAEQIRLKFEMEAPKRHPKPSRSEPNLPSLSVVQAAEVDLSATPIPELFKFEALMTQPLFTEFRKFDSEEFMETNYYKHLNAVDKTLHHTTGSGFIQVDSTSLPDDTSIVHELKMTGPPGRCIGTFVRTRSYGNPATNDWIPSTD